MILTSPAFMDQRPIPIAYTGESEDISPVLEWSGVPDKTRSFALICEDHDAFCPKEKGQFFVHWLAYEIPANIRSIPEAMPPGEFRINQPFKMEQGMNSFGKIGYRGPLPPRNSGAHHYVFTLYALDQKLNLQPGLSKSKLIEKVEGHIIATAQLTGTYARHL
jgi:Raf kinase inhibitor-like YbhB/YbcL family protein